MEDSKFSVSNSTDPTVLKRVVDNDPGRVTTDVIEDSSKQAFKPFYIEQLTRILQVYDSITYEMSPKLPKKLRHLPVEPVRDASNPKIGRNDPCPCGSGKKYKHCFHNH